MKSKKKLLKILKISLREGTMMENFYTEKISTWIKEDGNEKNIMVRSVKLLRTQNRDYMGIIFLVMEFLENKKKI